MLEFLQEKVESVVKNLRGYGKLSESNVADAVREVRLALLAADVNYQIAKDLCDEVKKKCLGEEVLKSIQPGQQFVKIFHDEMLRLFSEGNPELSSARPLRILLTGLNGAGKTTTAAKLALHFRKRVKEHRIALVAGDITRPAAVQQLQTLGKSIDIPVWFWPEEKTPADLARRARAEAEKERIAVLIFDAAGRLDLDEALLAELKEVSAIIEPQETLLVADSATGQSAVKIAQAFKEHVPLTGIVLSKFDGDARGGAALSMQRTAGIPVKFLGVGEKPDAFEVFDPERLVGRILGMGDIVGLVEKAQEAFDADSMVKMEEKLRKNSFDLQDFIDQMRFMRKLGPMENLLGMIPGMPKVASSGFDEKRMRRVEAMVLSMTPQERRKPDILNAKRRQRIARGSGTSVTELNDVVHRFEEMKKMMSRFSRGKGGGPEKMLSRMMGKRG
ncbi:signal recognition particle subunit FFH/SRP54 (srp54) [Verrucomicrobium sp. GAS474]|uniref:signal recognition particle protein n=1 Tax=Verrucomicrobium sp. GAS474 TaxID=1882831 RepID=UPI00087AB040|nr:signal recognition particle protein [Verrucomicrobium sp. GAS474]SDU20820.1 signal recognition particle subunit FFH/SRP54 (srp54) [Verrucomicrobium sp. GAS474]